MTHLITGGSGFLGNLIMKRLLARGEKVKVLDIWKDNKLPSAVEFIECDIRNRDLVKKAMENVSVVHNNVALVPLTKSGKNFWQVNVFGNKIIAEEALKANVKNFIHMSSSALYGSGSKCPINNDTPLNPVEIYGKAKLAGEYEVKNTLEGSNTSLITIRPRTIIGKERLGIFQILFDWVRENKNIYVIGSGNVNFQFIHAHDLMDFYMLILDLKKSGTYNVGTDRFSTLRNALENLVKHAGSSSIVKSLPTGLTINTLKIADWLRISPLAPWHYLTYHKEFYFDVEPLKNLGWKPKYSNDEMFAESYDWFINNYGSWLINKSASAHRKPTKEMIIKIMKFFS